MSALPDPESIGPVDVAVLHFEGNNFNGEIAPALVALQDEGIVRIIDLAFVMKDGDGKTTVVEVADADVADAFTNVFQSQMDLLSDADLDQFAEDLAPSSSALVIVWENSWAARLGAAIRGSNGTLAALERIPRANVLAALAALDEE